MLGHGGCQGGTLRCDASIYSCGLYSYGLYSYGTLRCDASIYSYGLYSYGLYNYGLYSYGLYSYGPVDCVLTSRYGLYSYGLYSYGPVDCVLTSSGIETTVKLWEPLAAEPTSLQSAGAVTSRNYEQLLDGIESQLRRRELVELLRRGQGDGWEMMF